MKVFSIIFTLLAIAVIGYNATKLNFDSPFQEESFTAIITIIIALCAIVLIQILRVSIKIDKLNKQLK